jgi:predicted nucleic acid-binding protein
MIVLDTNTISERTRLHPNERVELWFDSLERENVATTTVTLAELRLGTALMPQGRKRAELKSVLDDMLDEVFEERIYSFDVAAAVAYPSVITKRRSAGLPIEVLDAQIAAICISRGAALATRNTEDFDELGITLINPWEY